MKPDPSAEAFGDSNRERLDVVNAGGIACLHAGTDQSIARLVRFLDV